MSGLKPVLALQGDTFDLIAWREYKDPSAMLPALLKANPHLRKAGAVLPVAAIVYLPEEVSQPKASGRSIWS